MNASPEIAIVMGSNSDWPTMKEAADVLDELGVPYHVEVVSAHRTPGKTVSYTHLTLPTICSV